jgi:hypothetical protein
VVNDGHDLERALKRAAREHRIKLQHARPSREALHAAIHEYRALFRPQQEQQLEAQRGIAAEAMRTFSRFQPRLIGALVRGDGPLEKVQLLLTADTPEQVMLALNDQRIPWRESEVVLHYAGGRRAARPALRFMAGDTRVELILLDGSSRSDPPRDPVTGGRLEALSPAQLETLLAGTAD